MRRCTQQRPTAARDTRLVPPSGQMQADVYSLQAEDFVWQPVSPAVGAVRNDNPSLILPIDTPTV
ncbi:hypothetical protein CS366_22130 [Serratia marcescens]|nr:hypothetical protein AM470_13710 [Serratia marcescens]PHY72119.1 hypothetical protein CS366_22130 [Serratia marcescens]PIC07759.1 hypothetical protein CS367_06460 [Serratia marcescens]RTF33565.1 hypothetical protein D9B83_20720 [Serratia marcescens]